MAGARPRGEVLRRKWRSGTGFALRFTAYGRRHYVTLGMKSDGWTRERAEEELQNLLADVRRGIWIPPSSRRREETAPDESRTDGARPMPLFGEFAVRMIARGEARVAPTTTAFRRWTLSHLLPYFGD